MAILNPLDVPCGPIMSTEDLANDEHVRGRDMWVESTTLSVASGHVGMPIKLSDSPARIDARRSSASTPNEVLKEVLGYDDAKDRRPEAGRRLSVPPKKAA